MVGARDVGDGAITTEGLLVDGDIAVVSFVDEVLDSDRVLFLGDEDIF